MRVAGLGEGFLQGGWDGHAHPAQPLEEDVSPAETVDEGIGHGRQEVAFGDAAAGGVLGASHHVDLRVERGQSEAGEDGVRGFRHREGAFQPRCTPRGEPRIHRRPGRGRDCLHGHVGDALGVGVVEFPGGEGAAGVEEGAALEPRHAAHPEDAGGLGHLGGGGDGVVIDGTDHAQPGAPGAQGRAGGGIGAEGVAGVDVVVGFHHPVGESLLIGDDPQHRQPFLR